LSFLLDTNALSEPQRPRPDAGYMAWIDGQPAGDLYLSVLSLGELKRGLAALEPGARRVRIEAWLSQALAVFSDRMLPIDAAVATAWAAVSLNHRQAGLTISAIDELIAATAIVHDLTVVSRNLRDFQASGCKLLSPWSDGS
jgi:predicted nucleic acid-binding protein